MDDYKAFDELSHTWLSRSRGLMFTGEATERELGQAQAYIQCVEELNQAIIDVLEKETIERIKQEALKR